MYMSDYDEPCGIKLVRLINTQSTEIIKREIKGHNRMRLYRTGEYWCGFEHSAYFMGRIFSETRPFIVNSPKFPFTIVVANVSEKDFKKWRQKHDAIRIKEDYAEYEVEPFVPLEYGKWHRQKVKYFTEDLMNGMECVTSLQ